MQWKGCPGAGGAAPRPLWLAVLARPCAGHVLPALKYYVDCCAVHQGHTVEKAAVCPYFEALAALHQGASADGQAVAALAAEIAAQAAQTG